MNYVKERVQVILRDLNRLTVRNSFPEELWESKKGFFLTPSEAEKAEAPWQTFDTSKDYWHGPAAHYWFRKKITVPAELDGKALWLKIGTNVTYWDAVTPQMLIFVDGEVLQGVDANHQEVLVCSKAKAGQEFTIDIQAYTGSGTHDAPRDHSDISFFACLQERDPAINKLYYDLLTANQVMSWMPEEDMNRLRLEKALTGAINLLDLKNPQDEAFMASVGKAQEFTTRELYEKLIGTDVVATCVGHTHIDIAWWWTVAQTREKAVRSFSTVLELMREYPDYIFMSSQPVLYKFVKERYPEVYEQIKARVKEGRWEVEGGMWVEADCNVTSGESLVRQLLVGKKFFQEEFGYDCKVVWLPDVFGYSANLPQIMKKSGIDYFMTTKIAWNQVNKFPYDTFQWEGIDGTEIFTHLITTQNSDQSKDSFFTTYNGLLDGVSVMRTWDRYQQKALNQDVLISYGYGDGGGGTTREMIEIGERMQAGLAGTPQVRFASSRQYFDELYQRLENDPALPRWYGELYLEYHRGTYTSMARNKKSNRRCENLLQEAEMLSLWAEKYGVPYPKALLDESWEMVLTNQFHDILPGSSIKEVYDVTKEEYEALENQLEALIAELLKRIAAHTAANKGDLVVFNTLSFPRNDLVIWEDKVEGLKATTGETIAVQQTHDGKSIAFVGEIPSKGWRYFQTVQGSSQAPASPFIMTEKAIETPFYDVVFDEDYEIVSLLDKKAQRQVLPQGGKANRLVAYEDKPMNYDNWDIDVYYTEKPWPVNQLTKATWIENGPVRATLEIERTFAQSTIKQLIHFYAQKEGIDFETFIDWKQHQVLLKAEFDVNLNAHTATYDIQYGETTRPVVKNTSWDQARFEVCGHKWMDMSEGDYGVSLLNDSKYGHSAEKNKMCLTLLKSGIVPNPVTDQEEHHFIYTLYPHLHDHSSAATIPLSYSLNQPLKAVSKTEDKGKDAFTSLLAVDTDHVVVETIKKAEALDGCIVRVVENHNTRKTVKLQWHETFKEVWECDLLERPIRSLGRDSSRLTLEIKPFEIVTLKFC